jgi:hypothetical protein
VSADEFQYLWWSNAVRKRMVELISQMGLAACAVCSSKSGMYIVPWPAMVQIGGFTHKPVGEPHRGNVLFMALVRCESCGHTLMFDSGKLTGEDEPSLWTGPGPPTD